MESVLQRAARSERTLGIKGTHLPTPKHLRCRRKPGLAAHGVPLAWVGAAPPRLMGQVKPRVTHCHRVWPFPNTLPPLTAQARCGPARTCDLAGMRVPAGMDTRSHSAVGFRGEGGWFSFSFAVLVFLPVGSTQVGAGAVGPGLGSIFWRRQPEPGWRACWERRWAALLAVGDVPGG